MWWHGNNKTGSKFIFPAEKKMRRRMMRKQRRQKVKKKTNKTLHVSVCRILTSLAISLFPAAPQFNFQWGSDVFSLITLKQLSLPISNQSRRDLSDSFWITWWITGDWAATIPLTHQEFIQSWRKTNIPSMWFVYSVLTTYKRLSVFSLC